MATARQVEAFLLSREWRDADDGVEIVLWARAKDAPVRVRLRRQEAVMFVPRTAVTRAGRRVSRALATMEGEPVDALYFRRQRDLVEERTRLRELGEPTLESDVKPSDRYVMERFVTGALRVEGVASERRGVLYFDNPRIKSADVRVDLSLLALDIETDGFDGPLLSAAVAIAGHERVFVRGRAPDPPRERGRGASHRDDAGAVAPSSLVFVRDERELLSKLFAAIVALDPDVICGWNVLEFDLAYLDARARALGVPFAIGRAGERARILLGGAPGRASIARVPGRVVLDGIATLKSATYDFERFTLEHVARELVGRGKKVDSAADRVAEIRRMHAEDVEKLAEYNLEDCRLVLDIFAETDLLGFATERARLTGLPMDRQGGSVAAFDHLYLPRLHRRGVVARDVGFDMDVAPSPGGHVLDSVPGLYRGVLSFDFRSLYPSIIRTFCIDPLGLAQPGVDPVPGADGALFAREGAILPELVTTLHEARSVAMASKNAALSRAIKILMNSFYGVLGTPGCRFFDPRLPTSITRRGHAIIERARAFFEDAGLPVIYGDTDSLFVHVGDAATEAAIEARGRALAEELTRSLAAEIAEEARVESRLELRFESHYLRFLMPTTRGSERGSKKRYAGTVRKADGSVALVVRGLEAVRRDWTPLARRVQLELLRRVLSDERFEEWLVTVARDLTAGRLDDELVYRKRLRRSLDAYAEEGSGTGTPPHVQAARMLEAADGESHASGVAYVMTTSGPEPIELRSRPIDYAHYLERQVAPACDVVLTLLGTSFEKIAGAQTSLF
ncbi:MAG: DNA polymerase II [Labilithrix sp.]|nr:DNA polymerase II [Labilithrix sp.]